MKCNLRHQSQSGFRSKHSTESAIVRMINSWLTAVNDGKRTGCVMVDYLARKTSLSPPVIHY